MSRPSTRPSAAPGASPRRLLAALPAALFCGSLGAWPTLGSLPTDESRAAQASTATDPDAAADDMLALCRLGDLALEVGESLAELRGRDFDCLPQVVCTGSEDLARRARSAGERAAQDRAPWHDPWREVAAKMLAMIPADLDLAPLQSELYREQAPAHYDVHTNTLYVLGELGDGMGRMVLAGELAHVLHQQLYGLERLRQGLRGQGDAQLALQALIEGAETALTVLWVQEHPEDINLNELVALQSALSTGVLESAPPYVWKPFVALSARGDTFLRRTSRLTPLAGPTRVADIEQAFDAPPRSTEQILHPVKYWKRDRLDEPWNIEVDAAHLPAGWSVAFEDTLGELYLSILTEPFAERQGMTHSVFDLSKLPYTNTAAAGWGGDRVLILENGEAQVLRLFTRWDTRQDAEEFEAAVALLEPEMRAQLESLGHDAAGQAGLALERPDPLRVQLTVWIGSDRHGALDAAGRLRFSESR